MSVTVELYKYDEEMDDAVLSSLGIRGGIVGKLTDDDVTREEKDALLMNAESHTVGQSTYEFPRRLLRGINVIQTVDAPFLAWVDAAIEEDEADPQHDPETTFEWLRARQGDQVFVKGL